MPELKDFERSNYSCLPKPTCLFCGVHTDECTYDEFLDAYVCENCQDRAIPDEVAAIHTELRAIITHVSEAAEATATPSKTIALQSVRRHLLEAYTEIEKVGMEAI